MTPILRPTQIRTLLQMQDAMNAKVNASWLLAGFPWLRAVVVEGTEAMEHYGWKWWKKQDANIEQLRIELVDIFHFALSDVLVHFGGDYIASTNWLQQAMLHPGTVINVGRAEHHLANYDVLAKLELMVGMATERRFSFPLLASIMADVGMTWETMYTGYVAKNVLNTFRQDNGYKDGTYRKDWNGAEDNVRLAEIVKTLDPSAESFPDLLYCELRTYYATTLPDVY